jgi:uncharacterized OB-fold protein
MMMSKKEQERPRFRCDKCGCIWVYHEPMCIVCGTLGTALNKRAEWILRKVQRSEVE